MPELHDKELTQHIIDEINYILENSNQLTKEDFINNETLKRAFVRSIEIIGEAVKKLSPAYKEKHFDVDWKSIAGTRDKLIHHYFGIDYDIVWDIVTHEIPKLKNNIH